MALVCLRVEWEEVMRKWRFLDDRLNWASRSGMADLREDRIWSGVWISGNVPRRRSTREAVGV